jgi:microcystin-dependent protein
MSEPFIGEIKMFAGGFAPRGYAFCNGQLLAIQQNAALFSILGTTYGGNGIQTFGLPNLQGRMPMHWGNGPGLTPRVIGETSGTETVTLLTPNLPAHSHAIAIPCNTSDGTVGNPQNQVLAVPNAPEAGAAVNAYSPTPTGGDTLLPFNAVPTGSNVPISIIPPFQCVSFIIALQGIFPSRN